MGKVPEGTGKKRKHGAAAPAGAVEVAGVDDLLREILVRLPDTASLARAALACKGWRRVASDPSFLRRFHSLHHPPPLLGFIMSEPLPEAYCSKGADTSFVRVPSRNPHLDTAAADADFYIEDFTANNPRTGYEWVLRSCDGGLLLLTYGFFKHEEVAIYDPIGRNAVFLRRPDIVSHAIHLPYALVTADDATFRVFAAYFSFRRFTGAVFDSRTGEWAALPGGRPALENDSFSWHTRGGMRAGRFAYWQSNNKLRSWSQSFEPERTLVLDTITMEWTLIQVPFHAKESYCVADMAEHGGLCLVASTEQTVQLWVRDNSGWVIKKSVSLLKQFVSLKNLRGEWMKRVRILAARDGYIYMEFWSILKPNSYLLVLNWETMKLSVHANRTSKKYRGPAFPFFMTWAPPLLSPAEVQAFGLQGV